LLYKEGKEEEEEKLLVCCGKNLKDNEMKKTPTKRVFERMYLLLGMYFRLLSSCFFPPLTKCTVDII
jgi:hypothetical protein